MYLFCVLCMVKKLSKNDKKIFKLSYYNLIKRISGLRIRLFGQIRVWVSIIFKNVTNRQSTPLNTDFQPVIVCQIFIWVFWLAVYQAFKNTTIKIWPYFDLTTVRNIHSNITIMLDNLIKRWLAENRRLTETFEMKPKSDLTTATIGITSWPLCLLYE